MCKKHSQLLRQWALIKIASPETIIGIVFFKKNLFCNASVKYYFFALNAWNVQKLRQLFNSLLKIISSNDFLAHYNCLASD